MPDNEIRYKIHALKKELNALRSELNAKTQGTKTVMVPDEVTELFSEIERKVEAYFDDVFFDPVSGEITVHGERYVLFRANSMSVDFIDFVKQRYKDRPEQEAINIGSSFLYDNAKVIGKKDALAFHRNLDLKEPIEKLAAGPVHFAFTGWANVEISPDSNPVADDSYFLKFYHHNSFEAQSWLKSGKNSKTPVCTMNCGYSAGWCEESFGLSLTTVEVACEAQGADHCTFIMAPTDKIEEYVEKESLSKSNPNIEIPVFFNSIIQEERLKESLQQKEFLIQEIHHRVKNNLQVISSLLKLQMNNNENEVLRDQFGMSINRVNTMAAVHELLYLEKNFDQIQAGAYFHKLVQSFVLFYTVDQQVDVQVDIQTGDWTIGLEKSIPLALMLNEITCNAFKHAFKENGTFFLNIRATDDHLIIKVGDDGPGLNGDMKKGLGSELIEILCDQLDAQLETDSSPKGLHYTITLPA